MTRRRQQPDLHKFQRRTDKVKRSLERKAAKLSLELKEAKHTRRRVLQREYEKTRLSKKNHVALAAEHGRMRLRIDQLQEQVEQLTVHLRLSKESEKKTRARCDEFAAEGEKMLLTNDQLQKQVEQLTVQVRSLKGSEEKTRARCNDFAAEGDRKLQMIHKLQGQVQQLTVQVRFSKESEERLAILEKRCQWYENARDLVSSEIRAGALPLKDLPLWCKFEGYYMTKRDDVSGQ